MRCVWLGQKGSEELRSLAMCCHRISGLCRSVRGGIEAGGGGEGRGGGGGEKERIRSGGKQEK